MRLAVLPVLALAACVSNPPYSPPEEAGLVPVRAYPTDADVCLVVGESAVTQEFLDDSAILVACPLPEVGAIEDRVEEGGLLVAVTGDWQLISIPD